MHIFKSMVTTCVKFQKNWDKICHKVGRENLENFSCQTLKKNLVKSSFKILISVQNIQGSLH